MFLVLVLYCCAEIDNFKHLAFDIVKNVLWLEVTVHDLLVMHVDHSRQNLPHQLSHFLLGKALIAFDHVKKIASLAQLID